MSPGTCVLPDTPLPSRGRRLGTPALLPPRVPGVTARGEDRQASWPQAGPTWGEAPAPSEEAGCSPWPAWHLPGPTSAWEQSTVSGPGSGGDRGRWGTAKRQPWGLSRPLRPPQGPGAAEQLSPDPDQSWPTWAGLTLVGHRPLAALPSQVLDVVQGNGPQGWLAAQSGLKHNLTGRRRGRVGSQRQSPRLSPPDPHSERQASPGTPRHWPPPPGLPATGAAGARPHPTRPAGPGHCSGAPSARPCLRAGQGGLGQPQAPLPPPPPPAGQPTHRSAQGSP